MKISTYTFSFIHESKAYFFNSLTGAIFAIPESKAHAYQTILENPDSHNGEFGQFIERMKERGFVVEDDTDEKALTAEKYQALRKPHQFHLMILPTYQCNLRCWYCTQKHADSWMTDETVERIKLLIRNELSKDVIKDLRISWFGGEPLLGYGIVKSLTEYGRDICKELNKHFTAGITTNSTLLTPERIEELREAGVTDYQITIDGKRDVHDKIKVLGKKSAYDTTLNNINMIAQHSHVNLRFNYTATNLEPNHIISELNERLNSEIRHNVHFDLQRVWQENSSQIDTSKVDSLLHNGANIGLATSLSQPGLCYVDQHHFYCVFPNGKVGKCDNLDPEEAYGYVNESGKIIWDSESIKYALPSLFNCKSPYECELCKFLPFCWGPCSAKREPMWRRRGKIECMYTDKETAMKEFILNYYKTQKEYHHNAKALV
ncbi:MAG: radical SAM protein [Bacteroides sp.]|nr:radical SAM protein [Bacteroides sp.]